MVLFSPCWKKVPRGIFIIYFSFNIFRHCKYIKSANDVVTQQKLCMPSSAWEVLEWICFPPSKYCTYVLKEGEVPRGIFIHIFQFQYLQRDYEYINSAPDSSQGEEKYFQGSSHASPHATKCYIKSNNFIFYEDKNSLKIPMMETSGRFRSQKTLAWD